MENNTNLNNWVYLLYNIYRNTYIWKGEFEIINDKNKVNVAEFISYLHGNQTENAQTCEMFAKAINEDPNRFCVTNLFGESKFEQFNMFEFLSKMYGVKTVEKMPQKKGHYENYMEKQHIDDYAISPNMTPLTVDNRRYKEELKKLDESCKSYTEIPTIIKDPSNQFIVMMSEDNINIKGAVNMATGSSKIGYLLHMITDFAEKYGVC